MKKLDHRVYSMSDAADIPASVLKPLVGTGIDTAILLTGRVADKSKKAE